MKAGLEIHQQLDVGKLFSAKASIIEDTDPDSIAHRTLHLTASELGEADKAAAAEIAKDRTYEYHGHRRSSGLVELDEEPPSDPNPRALETAFRFAQLTGAQLIDEIVPMRKIVVDGSNTSGFQRTMLYAMRGTLEDPDTKLTIPIPTMMLEEDSGKRADAIAQDVTAFDLSRLGIPLLEITTDPVFTDPEQLKSGALLIGSTLRLLSGVKRGLGTIRQDVNISVDGGARCEIKGAQDVRTMDDLARSEVTRQESIIAFTKQVKREKRKVPKQPKIVDVSNVFTKTDAKVIKGALKKGAALALHLPGWAGLLGLELSPNTRVGSELSGYAKAHTGLKGLFHSDELPKYGITEQEVASVRDAIGAETGDAFILIAADEPTARRGLELALERLAMIVKGVPSEVRRAKPDNSTEYLRELPGAARMYPETDLIPFRSDSIDYEPAKTRAQLEAHYRDLGLSDEFARIVIDSYERDVFDRLVEDKDAKLVFKALYLFPKEAKKRHSVDVPIDETFVQLLDALLEGDLLEDSFVDALVAAQEDPLDTVLERFKPADESELRSRIEAIVRTEREKNPDVTMGALMGAVMRGLDGKVSGKDAQRIIQELETR